MADNEKELEALLKYTLDSSETFSDEMIDKVRYELLKARKDAEQFYSKTKKAETT